MQIVDRFLQTGKWWEFEPERESVTYFDSAGIRRKKTTPIPSAWHLSSSEQMATYEEDHTVDLDLKIHKTRDEKVARACGEIADPQFQISPIQGQFLLSHCLSGYSFGHSCMLAEEIPALAAHLGYGSAILADRYALTGASEFSRISEKVGIKPLIGATVECEEGGDMVLVAQSKRGYRELSQLITRCHLGEPRLHPLSRWRYLEQHTADLICLTGGTRSQLHYLLAKRRYLAARDHLERLQSLYRYVYIEIERSLLPGQMRVEQSLLELADHCQVPILAGGAKTHATKAHFPALDVITCATYLSVISGTEERKPKRSAEQPPGRNFPYRSLNAERYLRNVKQFVELFQDLPQAIENGARLADLCDHHVLPDRTKLPKLHENEAEHFRNLVLSKLSPSASRGLIKRTHHEIERILRLGFSGHFLVAADFCDWARGKGIHFSARGSVVDSVVSYLLGFSRINAHEHRLHFDRFLPEDGTKRPDIDIDFEAFRREEIRQYLSQKYGRDRVATVAAIGSYSVRGIIREVGKVMELPQEAIGFLAKRVHGGVAPEKLESALNARPELRDSGIDPERYRWVLKLATRMTDIPRNMRAHSSGIVISSEPLSETVPVQYSGVDDVPIIQWDKRSAKYYFDKFDVLCLRGQDVLSDTEEQLRRENEGFSVLTTPIDDESSYFAMRTGQLIGIPQSASPAMRQAHIRMKTKNLTDASLVQAGIRPGVGGAVKINELIARRRGKPYHFDHPKLEDILANTYGIIVFQEQVDQLLQEFGGYSSGEAEDIRESIFKKRRQDFADSIKHEVLCRIVNQGFSQAIAEQVYDLVSGFNGYGFAQGHALAFAEISIRCIHLQQNYPAQYFAALLNSQPAGYYGPATIANEARIRGVQLLPACVNHSQFDFVAENTTIRIGLRQISGISQNLIENILKHQPFEDFYELVERTQPNRDELEILILCGATDSLHPHRRNLMWSVGEALDWSRASQSSLPLQFATPPLATGNAEFSQKEKSIFERRYLHLDVDFHLMKYERQRVIAKGGLTGHQVQGLPPGQKVFAVGNPIRLRFPPTKSGKRVVFFDLEDETGILNVTCFDQTYMKDGHAIICSPYVTVVGETQDRDGHIAFLAHRVFPYRPVLQQDLGDPELPIATADYLVG